MLRCQQLSLVKSRMRGGAMAETLISMVIFIPLFFSIPVLGKYQDIKQKSLEASRYAVWERTIWAADRGVGWESGTVNEKGDDDIVEEIDRRFYGHPLQGLDDSRQTENPLWGTRQNGEDIRFLGSRASSAQDTNSVTPLRAELQLYEAAPGYGAPGVGEVVDAVANLGLDTIGGVSAIEPVTNIANSISLGNCELGINLDSGMGLGHENRVDMLLETPVNNVLGQTDLLISTTAGILSNAWVVPNDSEALYRERVGHITASEPVNCVTEPAAVVLGRGASLGADRPLFGEVRRAAPARDTLNPGALPEERRIR